MSKIRFMKKIVISMLYKVNYKLFLYSEIVIDKIKILLLIDKWKHVDLCYYLNLFKLMLVILLKKR